MKYLHYLLTIAAAIITSFFAASCESITTSDDFLISPDQSQTETQGANLDVRSDLRDKDDIFAVSEEMAVYYAKSFEGKSKITSVEPYEYRGVTCFYIINFERGWMAIAADSRVQPIIGESDSDILNINRIESPEVKAWLEMNANFIANVKTNGLNEYNEESVSLWNSIRDIIGNGVVTSIQPEGVAWVKVTTTTTNTETIADVPHLMQTKWGQGDPWNCTYPIDPYIYNDYNYEARFVSGCCPTAIAQVLYYFHYKTGYPNALWHYIEPSISQFINTYQYKLSLYKDEYTVNSNHWSSMPLTSSESGDFSYVSDLMLDLGVRMNATFSFSQTSVTSPNNYLAQCGISATHIYYDYDSVREDLVNQKPVLITALNSLNANHMWVIDGCLDKTVTTTTSTTYYEYEEGVLYPSGSEYLTNSDVLSVYPNAYDGMSFSNTNTVVTQYLLMNFGWDGMYDNGQYSILNNSSDWKGYNSGKTIFCHLNVGQLN